MQLNELDYALIHNSNDKELINIVENNPDFVGGYFKFLVLNGHNVSDQASNIFWRKSPKALSIICFLIQKNLEMPKSVKERLIEDPTSCSWLIQKLLSYNTPIPEELLEGASKSHRVSEHISCHFADASKEIPDILLDSLLDDPHAMLNVARRILLKNPDFKKIPQKITDVIIKDSEESYQYLLVLVDNGCKNIRDIPDKMIDSILNGYDGFIIYNSAKILIEYMGEIPKKMIEVISTNPDWSYDVAYFIKNNLKEKQIPSSIKNALSPRRKKDLQLEESFEFKKFFGGYK